MLLLLGEFGRIIHAFLSGSAFCFSDVRHNISNYFDAIAPDWLHYTLDNMWGLRRIMPDMYATLAKRKYKECVITPRGFQF
jgi:hypothetical protein